MCAANEEHRRILVSTYKMPRGYYFKAFVFRRMCKIVNAPKAWRRFTKQSGCVLTNTWAESHICD